MTYDSLLTHVPIHDSNIFRMQGEDHPIKEAARYQKMLEKELPLQDGFPIFDLVLLGMGDDGHTASIFPDNMDLLQSDQAVAVGIHPVSGQERITLTGKTILEAKQVVFLITGSSKATVLRQIIKHDPQGENYPAFYVAKNAKSADFYLDKAAAALL
jgi:6-phosphogluconolactonase